MASAIGYKLIHIAPLLINTFTLQYSCDEQLFLSSFTTPASTSTEFTTRSNALLPAYFTEFIRKGKWIIIIHYPLNMVLGSANLLIPSRRADLVRTGAAWWYVAGVSFTVAHMLWGPKALRLIDDIENNKPEGRSLDTLRTWLEMNAKRSLVADLPAWVCYLVGFLVSMD